MAITFSGPDKLIQIDAETDVDLHDVYRAAMDWGAVAENLRYVIPMAWSGRSPLGGGVYSDVVYSLGSGWKFQPVGYASGTIICVRGSVAMPADGYRTVPPVTGQPVSWEFQVATAGTVTTVSTGSGLSFAEHDQLMALPTAATIRNGLALSSEVDDALAAIVDEVEAVAGRKKVIAADGQSVQIFDRDDNLLVTLTRSGTGPYTWTPTWE